MKKKKVGVRDLPVLFKELGEALEALETAEERLKTLCAGWGIDINSVRYDPRPKKRRKTTRRNASRLNGESIRVLKVKGNAPNAVIAAGYPTFEKLAGKSRKLLKRHKGVGDTILNTLDAALKARKMKGFRD